MTEMLKSNKNINLIEFRDGHLIETITNTTMIMQLILPNSIRPELKLNEKTKIIFWTLFHYNLVPDFLPLKGLRKIHHRSKLFKKLDFTLKRSYYNNLTNFVQELHKASSIYFMDKSTYEITNQYLDLNISQPNFLPICIDKSNHQKKINLNQNKISLNMCWVGRIEDFKTTILKYSIIQAYKYANKARRKINFSIIGYGKDLDQVKHAFRKSDYFNYNFMGKMDVKNLHTYLINNIDIVMSMGTAALEGGRLGIPTVLLDASYREIPKEYNFRWLCDSDGTNVAQFIESNGFKNKGYSFDNIISLFDENPEKIGLNCKKYVEENHSTRMIADLLIEKAEQATFTWGDISPKLIKKNFIRQLYDYYRYKI